VSPLLKSRPKKIVKVIRSPLIGNEFGQFADPSDASSVEHSKDHVGPGVPECFREGLQCLSLSRYAQAPQRLTQTIPFQLQEAGKMEMVRRHGQTGECLQKIGPSQEKLDGLGQHQLRSALGRFTEVDDYWLQLGLRFVKGIRVAQNSFDGLHFDSEIRGFERVLDHFPGGRLAIGPELHRQIPLRGNHKAAISPELLLRGVPPGFVFSFGDNRSFDHGIEVIQGHGVLVTGKRQAHQFDRIRVRQFGQGGAIMKSSG
jgi:hypothetical protein